MFRETLLSYITLWVKLKRVEKMSFAPDATAKPRASLNSVTISSANCLVEQYLIDGLFGGWGPCGFGGALLLVNSVLRGWRQTADSIPALYNWMRCAARLVTSVFSNKSRIARELRHSLELQRLSAYVMHSAHVDEEAHSKQLRPG